MRLSSLRWTLKLFYIAAYIWPFCMAVGQEQQQPAGLNDQSIPQHGSESGDVTAAANNPTAPLRQLQMQDWYNPSNYGVPGESNLVLIRPFLPFRKHGWLPAQIARPELPLVSTPNGRTGLGDISGFDLFFLVDKPHLRFGLGPVLVVPSATNRYAGQGKWQAGPSSALIYTGVRGLVLGVLEQNPISFAGERGRPSVNGMSLQPIIVKNLPHAFFIREDPIFTFDWQEHGTATLPVNLGLGRVFKVGQQPINAYLQPEWTVRRPGYAGYDPPRFTLRLAVHLLYPNHDR